ncbi:AzlC family ABC transporter permease [Streptococcus gallolyticus]|nr:AzlC family ABC transporter permease [Streptococcus gallolyticus]MBY5040873.1 AzlC family ABC transporter permease [Streptococcus gallolyticus]
MIGGDFVKKSFVQGMQDAIPVGLGYVSIGLAFGIVAAGSGWSWWEVALSSIFVYAGSAQFALVSLLLIGDSLLAIAMTVFLINLRNMLMSLHATTFFKKAPLWEGMLIGTLITDESYGVLMGEAVHNDHIATNWMHGNNVFSYLSWILATVTGALLGAMIPNPSSFGLDYALVGMFIGIFIGQWEAMAVSESVKKLLIILLAVTVSFFAALLMVSQAAAVLIATLCGCAVGVVLDGN